MIKLTLEFKFGIGIEIPKEVITKLIPILLFLLILLAKY
jgi:hypothetical protein